MPRIAILLFNGCHASAVAAPIDIFHVVNTLWQNRSNQNERHLEWTRLTIDPAPITSAAGTILDADDLISDQTYDAVIIPSLFYPGKKRFQRRLRELEPATQWLRKQSESGAWIGASCTAVFLLASAGLLEEGEATATWWLSRHFAQQFPRVKLTESKLIVESQRIITAGTGMAHNHLALKIAEKFTSADLVRHAARLLLIGGQSTSQMPFSGLSPIEGVEDAMVCRAEILMQNHLQREFSLDQLANSLAVSPRTLIRRFKQATGDTPLAYFQKLRVEAAKQLLETTPCSFEEVVENIGYNDTSSFRRLFIRHVGLSPLEYRKQFSNML